jgi:hypothetical protein
MVRFMCSGRGEYCVERVTAGLHTAVTAGDYGCRAPTAAFAESSCALTASHTKKAHHTPGSM